MTSAVSEAKLKRLAREAKRARRKAYCPYSRYAVGAALIAGSGRVYTGANVENASYGLSLCAERVAVFKAVTSGEKSLAALAVAGRAAYPCGACRQVMLEFASPGAQLLIVDTQGGGSTLLGIAQSMPLPFDPRALFAAGKRRNGGIP